MQYPHSSLNINAAGHLTIGGADVCGLAAQYGTPLYLMDEAAVRRHCRAFVSGLRAYYKGDFRVAYASKAASFKAMYKICAEESVGADVVSGGELLTALRGGMPADSLYFHGNNKTEAELRLALEHDIHCIVLDNADEFGLLCRLAEEMGKKPYVGVRLCPGIEAHTHDFVQTGRLDDKFGVPLPTGDALRFIREILASDRVTLTTLHCHIGSQIFDPEPFEHEVALLMDFIAQIRNECGVIVPELNLGGGFGILYTRQDDPRDIETVVKMTALAVEANAAKHGLPLPTVVLEPGRSIAATAGITVYTIGSRKQIPADDNHPQGQVYLSVDGGMPDNPRYALYGAQYEVCLPAKAGESQTEIVSVAGRCCESGDFIGKEMRLQADAKPGDLLAVLCTGAYNYSMASHYNRVPKPPVVMVRDGEPSVAVRRETWDNVMAMDN